MMFATRYSCFTDPAAPVKDALRAHSSNAPSLTAAARSVFGVYAGCGQ